MNHPDQTSISDTVMVVNPWGQSAVVLVCEHAANFIPKEFDNLGLTAAALQSHAAWDPGAMAVAKKLSARLDATLIASSASRLLYDCNRAPSAPDAMPAKSEAFDVPGNVGLTVAARQARVDSYYTPFQATLSAQIATKLAPVIVTIHSFTPVFHGKKRDVEFGILHDSDARLADAMLASAANFTDMNVQRNAPYGPEHGVTHTLTEHAISDGHLNVMLEIRNDLVKTPDQHDDVAAMIAAWVSDALSSFVGRA